MQLSGMRLKSQRLAGCSSAAWLELVSRCPQATLYHRMPWLESLRRAYGFQIDVLGLVDEFDRLLAAGVFARSNKPFSRRLISLPFSDTCSLLTSDPAMLPQLSRALAEGECGRSGIEIRGYAAEPPWHLATTFLEWTMDLDQSTSQLHDNMAANFRRQIRRGEECRLEVRVGSGPKEMHAFYDLMCLTRYRLGLPVQPLKFFETLSEVYGPDCEIWLGSTDKRDHVGMLLLRDQDVLHFKWSARRDPLPPGANHLLISRILETYAQRCRTLNLGRSDCLNDGLNRFKREMGSEPRPLPYSFFPRKPAIVSSEAPSGLNAMLEQMWRRMPSAAARWLGPRIYKYLS